MSYRVERPLNACICVREIAKPTVFYPKRQRATSPGAQPLDPRRSYRSVLSALRVSPHFIYAHPTRLILFRPTNSASHLYDLPPRKHI